MIRYILLFILGSILYRLVKPMLSRPPENPHVKGQDERENSGKKKTKNIEDADFEDID